ncbi:MAG: nucleotidyltransferase family protein [Candidatus Heimdallarchaeaceae archaeon]|jgi:mannose-1-phosphate guanylyltransferase
MSDNVGVLFCGGEGTRMRPLTYYLQKVMMPIGADQIPLLEYVIKHFKKHSINDLILLVNYKKEQIQGYFGDGERWDMNLTYVPDKPGLKGTGTALLNAENWATILLSKGWQIRVGTAETDEENHITKFVEKPILPLLINTGISILEPNIFDYLKSFEANQSVDLSKDIFPYFVQKGNIMAYTPEDCFWEDIGSIERYERLDHEKITELMK